MTIEIYAQYIRESLLLKYITQVVKSKDDLIEFLNNQDKPMPDYLFTQQNLNWLYELVDSDDVVLSYKCKTVYFKINKNED